MDNSYAKLIGKAVFHFQGHLSDLSSPVRFDMHSTKQCFPQFLTLPDSQNFIHLPDMKVSLHQEHHSSTLFPQ